MLLCRNKKKKYSSRYKNNKVMAKKKAEDKSNTEKPRVHKDLNGFDIKINSFGEIQMSYDVEKINQFLNKTVDDKKLRNRK